MMRIGVYMHMSWILVLMLLGLACKTMENQSHLQAAKVDLLAMDIFELTLVEGNKARKFELDVTNQEFLKSEFQEKQWSEASSLILSEQQMNEVMKHLARIEEVPYPICTNCEAGKQLVYLNVFHEEKKLSYFATPDQCICPQHSEKKWKTMTFSAVMDLFQTMAAY